MAHCVLQLSDPWATTYLAAPVGASLGLHALMPLPGALFTPITVLYGPAFSYNLLSVIMPGLLAYAMYRLARLWCHPSSARSRLLRLLRLLFHAGLPDLGAHQPGGGRAVPADHAGSGGPAAPAARGRPGDRPWPGARRRHADRPGIGRDVPDPGRAGRAPLAVLPQASQATCRSPSTWPAADRAANQFSAASSRHGPPEVGS